MNFQKWEFFSGSPGIFLPTGNKEVIIFIIFLETWTGHSTKSFLIQHENFHILVPEAPRFVSYFSYAWIVIVVFNTAADCEIYNIIQNTPFWLKIGTKR